MCTFISIKKTLCMLVPSASKATIYANIEWLTIYDYDKLLISFIELVNVAQYIAANCSLVINWLTTFPFECPISAIHYKLICKTIFHLLELVSKK